MNQRPDINGGVAVGIVIDCTTGMGIFIRNVAHENPKWRLPGGTIEKGESIMDALIREIEEETGLVVLKTNIIPCTSVLSTRRNHYYHPHLCLVQGLAGLRTRPFQEEDGAIIEAKAFDPECMQVNGTMVGIHQTMLGQGIEKLKG